MEKRKPLPPTRIKVAPNRYLKRFVFFYSGTGSRAKLYIEKFPRWHFIKTPRFGVEKNLCKTYSMKGRSSGVYSLSGKLEKLSPRYYKVRENSARVPLANSCFELMVYVCQHKAGRLQKCSHICRIFHFWMPLYFMTFIIVVLDCIGVEYFYLSQIDEF